MKTYKIVRYFRDGRKPRTMRRGLTLEQAQSHCSQQSTRAKDGSWFDGYTTE